MGDCELKLARKNILDPVFDYSGLTGKMWEILLN